MYSVHMHICTLYSGKFSQITFPGARDSPDQGGLEHEAGRVGRPLQDRPGGQGQEGRQVLCSCGEFLFEVEEKCLKEI